MNGSGNTFTAKEVKMNSEKRSVAFRLDWRDSYDGAPCKTIAAITLLIHDVPVWPVKGEDTDEFEWFADELLAHLTECWKPILLRQTYPIPAQPDSPSSLLAEAKKRWLGLPDSTVEYEEREVAAFEDAHNLANAFGGVTGLLPLWFLRDQDEMIIDTQEQYMRVPFQETVDALVDVGNSIARRLQAADELKWAKLLSAWQHRDQADGAVLLGFLIGRDQATAASLIQQNVLQSPISVTEAANDQDELRIAARMAGPLPINQIKSVIAKVRTCDPHKAPRLESAVAAIADFIRVNELGGARPYVQGDELAKWLRRQLNLMDDRRIDPMRLLEREYGVDVRYLDFGIPSLDAISVWGPNHGPAVLLNRTAARVPFSFLPWETGATRVTAAHEMCHLLLDSEHSLSAVDVLGGRMPLRVEQRAKAFAAEFLLPGNEAAAVWSRFGSPIDVDGLRAVIKTLCRKHKVTESVAAWQIEHGTPPFHQDALAPVLDQIVPQR
jgi:Zn-dependent peptidase ImmA (M78 family)